jgi:VWFA-related protein
MLLLASVAASAAQRVSEDSVRPSATFKVGTKLVEVVVIARDKHGPITGLTQNDFTLLDNGIQQNISIFSVKSSRASAPIPLPILPSIGLPPGVITNRPAPKENAPATQTVLLLDRTFTSLVNQIFAIQRINSFLDLRRKRDGVGIYTLGGDLRVIQDVTDDDALLRRAARSLRAQDARNRNADTTGMTEKAAADYEHLNMLERVLALKHALQATARHLANIPGRKNLIWISEAFPVFYCPPHLPCDDYTPDMQEAARALNDANVALYAVDPRGLIGALGRMTGIGNAESRGAPSPIVPGYRMAPVGPEHVETMNLLAGLTGGEAYYNTNGLEESMLKAVEDSDVAYTLGFYPIEDSQDGKVHKLKVSVNRPGVSLRYRPSYFATKAHTEAERPTPELLLRDPLDSTQIGLFGRAVPDPERSGVFGVQISVDLHDIQLQNEGGKWIGSLQLAFHVEGAKAAQITSRSIEIPKDQLASALNRGLMITHLIEWAGKPSDLRVAIEDKISGAAGSLRIPLGNR